MKFARSEMKATQSNESLLCLVTQKEIGHDVLPEIEWFLDRYTPQPIGSIKHT